MTLTHAHKLARERMLPSSATHTHTCDGGESNNNNNSNGKAESEEADKDRHVANNKSVVDVGAR